MNKLTVALITLLFAQSVWGCSFSQRFDPFLEDPFYRSSKKPSAPIFEVKGIKRGFDDGNGGSCSDAGMITLAAKGDPSKSGIAEAYTFKLVEGKFEGSIFPQEPISSRLSGVFTFIWFDGTSEHQEPIDIKLEIRAVSPSGARSKAAYLRITHPGT